MRNVSQIKGVDMLVRVIDGPMAGEYIGVKIDEHGRPIQSIVKCYPPIANVGAITDMSNRSLGDETVPIIIYVCKEIFINGKSVRYELHYAE